MISYVKRIHVCGWLCELRLYDTVHVGNGVDEAAGPEIALGLWRGVVVPRERKANGPRQCSTVRRGKFSYFLKFIKRHDNFNSYLGDCTVEDEVHIRGLKCKQSYLVFGK